jgi:hypothetical protein
LGSPVEAEIESALEMEAISLFTLIQQQNTCRQSANSALSLRELIKCCLSSFDQLQPSQVKDCLSFLLRQTGGSATLTAAVSSVLMEAFKKSNECLKNKGKVVQILRNPTVLILDRELNGLPWECTPILQGVPVTRMPSLSFLLAAVSAKQVDSILRRGVDTRKTFYLIDPHESLEKTKVLLQPYFK